MARTTNFNRVQQGFLILVRDPDSWGRRLKSSPAKRITAEVHFGVLLCRNLGRLVPSNAAVLTDAKSGEFGALLRLSIQWPAFCTRSEQPRQARVQQSRKDSKVTRSE